MASPSDIYFVLIIFALPWNTIELTQTALFKQISATTDFLAELTIFNSRSRIECSAQCLIKMSSNACTAFAFDHNSGLCTCGKKRYTIVQDTGSVTMIHVIDSCPKIQTGQNLEIFVHIFSCSLLELNQNVSTFNLYLKIGSN